MSHSKGILFPKRSHFLGITRFSSFLLCMGMAAFNAGCSARNVQQSLVDAQQSLAEPGPANAETEVTDDRDAIFEEIVKCYPCFADPKADECNSAEPCDGVEELVKNGTYLNRFFENNQAAFDARFKIWQKKVNQCVDAYVNRETYTAADEPDWCLGNEYISLRILKSEKEDADWLKAHKLPDNYRMKNEKELKYTEQNQKAGYEITNSFEFDENNEELLPDLIRSETIDINKADEDGNTLMHRYGCNPTIVKALIDKGADWTLKNKDGKCAFYGIEDSLRRELILSGQDTNKVINSDGNTTLHNYANDIEIAKVLIQNGADVHQKNKEGRTPIFYARSIDAFKLLIENGADIKAMDNHHHTLLHAALNAEVLSFLHGQGLDIHAQNDDGQTPIFFAESADALKWYIDHGADIKVTDKHGNSLLHSKTFNPEMRGMMLNYNLDINAQNDEGQTPLFFVDLKNTDLLSAYIKAGADVNARDKHGNTVVHYLFAPEDSWKLLVQSGFNINTRNHRKEPAWFARYKQECIQSGDSWSEYRDGDEEKILDNYLELGADVNVHDKHGSTLLHRTLKCGKKDNKDIDCYDKSLQFSKSRIEKLIKAGIDVNARNEDGYTPIFSCFYDETSYPIRFDKECFNLYKKVGADIYATTNKGDNLFTECIREGCEEEDYDLIFKNQLHKNLSEMTIQRALEAYKKAVFDRDELCRKWEIYDPVDAGLGFYCHTYYADRELLPLMIDLGLDLKDGYMCILGVPKVDTDAQKHKIAAIINEKICGEGRTAFNQRNWQKKDIDNFIRVGADINTQDDEGKTPMMKNGIDFEGSDFGPYDCINVDKIIQFVKNGADLNLSDNSGKTILNHVIDLDDGLNSYCSCNDGNDCNIDIISYLIKNVDVHNRNKDGKTFLMYALDMGNDKYIKQLIHKGADANAKDNKGKSVLAYAANCNEDIIKLLIHKGADVHAKNNKGKSVLAYATAACNEKLIKQLIDKGADVNAKNNDGESVLVYAADCSEDIIQMLIDKGADVNAKDNDDKTVLMYAAPRCNRRLIEQLLAKDADVNAKDNTGKSVPAYAEECSDEIQELLKEEVTKTENAAN